MNPQPWRCPLNARSKPRADDAEAGELPFPAPEFQGSDQVPARSILVLNLQHEARRRNKHGAAHAAPEARKAVERRAAKPRALEHRWWLLKAQRRAHRTAIDAPIPQEYG